MRWNEHKHIRWNQQTITKQKIWVPIIGAIDGLRKKTIIGELNWIEGIYYTLN